MDLQSVKAKSFIIKLMYFMSFSAFASWLSYFNVYLKEIPHLSGFEIGVIAAIQQVNTVFVVPLWGIFADKFGRKRALSIALILSAFLILIFMINTSFLVYILFILIFTAVYNPLSTLFDSIALDFQEESKTVSYGEIRLWGSFGWAVSSVVTGQFINNGNLELIFPIASLLLLLTSGITIVIFKPLRVQSGIKGLQMKEIPRLLNANPSLLKFFFLIFFYSILAAPTFLFINMYYNEIGATYSQIGLAYAVQALSELPFFFYGKKIVDRFGAKKVFISVMFVTAARLLFYGLNDEPILAICMGVLQGFGIALFMISIIEYVHSIVPAHLRSTGQSLFYTFFSAGICVGNLFAGFLKDIISIQTTMLINSVLITLLTTGLIIQKKNNQKQ